VVQSLAGQVAETVAERRIRLAGGLTQEHPFVKALEKRLDGLRQDYAAEKARASRQFDEQLQLRQVEHGASTKQRLEQELESAKHLQFSLAEVLKAKDLESSSMGRKGLAIQTLQEELEAAKEEYERVSQRLRQLEMERGRPGRISVASYAATPIRPTVDKRYKFTVVALMASVFLAAGVALGIDRLDRRVQLPVDVAGPRHLRVLGTVPRLKDLKTGRVDREEFAEAYRVIRNYILQSANGNMPRSFAVTSAHSGEGKTGVAASLATSFTETGKRVLLIDGDIRKPDVGQLFHLPRHEGIEQALLARKPLEELVVASVVPHLDILPAASGNGWATRLLTPERANRLLEEANRVYDLVVVDSPPVLAVADALVWAGAVDAVLCTALADRSERAAVWAAHRRLLETKANVIGAVIGNMPQSAAYGAYGYSTSTRDREDGRRRKGGRQADSLPLLIRPGHEAEDAPTGDQQATER
jgi:capsular exopolysaccharide synthesis family protein